MDQHYTLTYDAFNRLLAGTHSAGQYTEIIQGYDLNGNILSRQTPNQATYAYRGNQLLSLNGSTDKYRYDANGNRSFDAKNYLAFTYNLLNLPQEAVLTTQKSIQATYRWAADGTKVSFTTGSGGIFYDYLGSLVLVRIGNMERVEVPFADGVVLPNEVEYFEKDHLGSVRTVVGSTGAISGRYDYYPFGRRPSNASLPLAPFNNYFFNGKEHNGIRYLNLLDYGARMYDTDYSIWMTMDPLAEIRPWESPYAFSGNNPVNRIDPDGRFPWLVPVIKGAIGAVVDAGAQVTIFRANGQTWSEAFSNIDYTSVGASFVMGAIGAPGASTAAKATVVGAIAIDAAVDVTGSGDIRYVTGDDEYRKTGFQAGVDAAASWIPGRVVDHATSSFSRAVAGDLGSSAAATMSNAAKTELRSMSEAVNSAGFQGAANAVADYTGGLVGGQVQQQIQNGGVVRPAPTIQPMLQQADATRMYAPMWEEEWERIR